MIENILKDAEHRMDQTLVHTRMELGKVRTGRANPELLDSIQVSYYGTMTPLNQVANISLPNPQTMSILPYEKALIPDIEKAILESNIGLTPSNNGNAVIVPIPQLSEERRKELIRYVHDLVEEGRVSVRNVRKDANHQLKALQTGEHISEDEIRRAENDIQTMTDRHINELKTIQEQKEKEIMKV
tara:strand:+ start:1558 stop:2115 length:558 start_codon:yes stop_codon:yes gene_type:complete